jgi:hypothetical protein
VQESVPPPTGNFPPQAPHPARRNRLKKIHTMAIKAVDEEDLKFRRLKA